MIKVVNSESDYWKDFIQDFEENNKDIYYTNYYYKMHEDNKDGKAQCFLYSEGEKKALYPYMINEICNYELKEKYYDIESAYGYGGPLSNCREQDFLYRFEKAFLNYCGENKIVAEFVRFHPLIKNHDIFKENIEVLQNRITVYLSLEKDIGDIWSQDIKSKNRNMIRKAEKSGLDVYVSNDYEGFKKIYKGTMDKVNASNYYYFSDEYFNNIRNNDAYNVLNIEKEDVLIASAIFIHYGDYFNYHLSGSLKEYLSFAPNNILLWEGIKLGKERNAKIFHFGGGLSNNLEDPLFKFKSSFSKSFANYYIGKRVHNKKIYDYLIENWQKRNNKKAVLFLQYKI